MFMILFLFLKTFSLTESSEISIHYKNLNYKIITSESRISLKAPNLDLSIVLEKCNGHIFKKLEKSLQNNIPLKSDIESKNVFSIKIDNTLLYDNYQSSRSNYYKDFIFYFKSLKIEETLNCR
jgi:hypothetical protein